MRSERGGIFFRLLFLMLFLGFLFLLYIVRTPLMRFAGGYWVIDEPAAPSDALIVLGDDNYAGDRAFHAAELYREKVAPVVVASGRMLRQNVSIADVMEHDLQSFGVPATAIVKLSSRAQNTREEAGDVAHLIQARGWKRVMVVTSNYHARRTRFIYARTLPSTVTLRVSGARDSEFDPSRWWESRQGQKLFLNEIVGYVVAWWELRTRPVPENQSAMDRESQPFFSPEPLDDAMECSRHRASNPAHPYLIGNTSAVRCSRGGHSTVYIARVTVLSGLPSTSPSLVATEFSVGGKHVA